LHQRGERQSAASHLAEAHGVAVAMHSRFLEFMYLLLQAEFAFDADDERAGLASLATALTLGKEQGYVNFYWWRPQAMSRLCGKALEAGLEIDYVQDLIRRRKLIPDRDCLPADRWPWPLKVYALGSFAILKNGQPIRSGAKVQRKPLDLLQALIALGGRDVAEAQLSDILWPDAAGDAAHRAFLTTLQRLRRLLGYKEALVSADGRLTLDPRYAWVDVSAFEHLLDRAETAEHERQGEAACNLRIKALDLYRGHFSGQDTAPAVSLRERLRDKYLRHGEALGRHWEQIGNWARALECYLKALEVDDLAEVFYQRLMVVYQHLERRAEALAAYERCGKTLAAALGIKPSAATQALYRALTGR
jgi:DNA-binding SARP family transcriptional activator